MSKTDTSRRSLLQAISALPAVGVAAAASIPGSALAAAVAPTPSPYAAGGTLLPHTPPAPRGMKGLFPRMDDINLESQVDFLAGRGKWMRQIHAAARERGEGILRARGIDPEAPSDMTTKDIMDLLYDDPVIARASRLGLDIHFDSFMRVRNFLHNNGSYYQDRLSAAEKKGQGQLVLSPGMEVPDYTKHEIHNQVGGYMGDPFAGMIYYYGTLILGDAANEQDAMFDNIAAAMPLPADGRVRRILDNGTGPGQLATALQRRFPDAEVWGIDVSGPMVRFAHMRANQIGSKTNFGQSLAENNGFPDNYFDIITSSSFHHEVTAEASKKIFKEIQRVLRPGGIFRPADSGTNGYPQTPQAKVDTYVSQRVNHEVWMLEWGGMDRFGAMRDAGLKVDPNGAKAAGQAASGGAGWWLDKINLVATKV